MTGQSLIELADGHIPHLGRHERGVPDDSAKQSFPVRAFGNRLLSEFGEILEQTVAVGILVQELITGQKSGKVLPRACLLGSLGHGGALLIGHFRHGSHVREHSALLRCGIDFGTLTNLGIVKPIELSPLLFGESRVLLFGPLNLTKLVTQDLGRVGEDRTPIFRCLISLILKYRLLRACGFARRGVSSLAETGGSSLGAVRPFRSSC